MDVKMTKVKVGVRAKWRGDENGRRGCGKGNSA